MQVETWSRGDISDTCKQPIKTSFWDPTKDNLQGQLGSVPNQSACFCYEDLFFRWD